MSTDTKVGPIPSEEEIRREGWDTPAAEYLNEQLNACELQRDFLLAACEEAEKFLAAKVHPSAPDNLPAPAALAAVRAAISKARGQS